MPRRSGSRARALTLASAFVLALCASASHAHADGVADEAELNFRLGAEHYQAGDFRDALVHFLASNRLVPNRNVKFNIARAFERLSQFPDAYRWYQDALDGETDAAVQQSIRDALARIAPNVAILDVSTTPPGATIYVNRRDLGSVAQSPRQVALPAGRYRVIVSLDGYEGAEGLEIDARVGTVTPVALQLTRIVGHVRVEAQHSTTVHLDDESAPVACTAPCTVDLPPGIHVLHFHRPGFRLLPRQLSVVAGETSTVRPSASPLTGSIVVTSDEREAVVEVDGVAMGFTPVVVPNVPVGRRHVRVAMRGFEPTERDVEVREGQQVDLRGLRLVPVQQVTTASRLPESVDDAPSSVSVVTPQELEAFQYPTIYEALRGLPGVTLTFDSSYASVAVRGLGQPNDYGNRLLILGDGAVLNDNIVYQSYVGYDGRVDLGDVDRIEVVRGPGSVLYGTGAVSGVVNLISRARDLPTGGHVAISTFDDAVARARAGATLNLGDDTGVWASIAAARSDGRDVEIDTSAGPAIAHGFDRFRALTLAGRAWRHALTAQWFFTTRDQRVPTGTFETRFDDPRTEYTDTRGLFEVRFEPTLSNRVQLFTRAHLDLTRFSASYAYDGEAPPDVDVNHEIYRGLWVGAEARVVLKPVRQLRLSFGGEGNFHVTASLDGSYADGTSYLHESRPYQVLAGYALVEWSPARALRISAGARFDGFRDLVLGGDSGSTFVASVNPRVAVIVKPTRRDVVKLMGGRAFRAPSLYELLYNDEGLTQVRSDFSGNELSPEDVLSAELEYSHHFGQDWVATVSLHSQLASRVVETARSDPADDTSPIYYRNGGTDQLVLGGDLQVRRDWRGGWSFAAMYGYLDARYTAQPPDAATPSRRLTNAPHHFGSVRGVVPLGDTGMLLAARATLEAPRRISLASDDETDPAIVTDVVLSGRAREYGVTWAVGVYNLFDWRYRAPVGDGYPSPAMSQAGRSFAAHLALTF